MNTRLENMYYVSHGQYVVRTQAGFKRAVKDFLKAEGYDFKVCGYPEKYPSYVEFTFEYNGTHQYRAKCTPLSQALERAREKVSRLEEADGITQATQSKDRT